MHLDGNEANTFICHSSGSKLKHSILLVAYNMNIAVARVVAMNEISNQSKTSFVYVIANSNDKKASFERL